MRRNVRGILKDTIAAGDAETQRRERRRSEAWDSIEVQVRPLLALYAYSSMRTRLDESFALTARQCRQ